MKTKNDYISLLKSCGSELKQQFVLYICLDRSPVMSKKKQVILIFT